MVLVFYGLDCYKFGSLWCEHNVWVFGQTGFRLFSFIGFWAYIDFKVYDFQNFLSSDFMSRFQRFGFI